MYDIKNYFCAVIAHYKHRIYYDINVNTESIVVPFFLHFKLEWLHFDKSAQFNKHLLLMEILDV